MIVCPHCGEQNPQDAEICQHCGEPLPAPHRPPRLLSQIQGLIPAEPVITSGALREPDNPLPETLFPERLAALKSEEKPEKEAAIAAITAGTRDESEQEENTANEAAQEAPPPAPPSQPVASTSPTPQRIDPLPIIAAAFFAVILLGSLWNVMYPSGIQPHTSVKNAFTFIEILPQNARVLLAWDYDPATQGELQLLAQPILQHLQRKQANLVFMSLRPFGPYVAADALKLMNRWRPPHMGGLGPAPTQFGFIPGESAALQSLAKSPVMASNQPKMSASSTGMRPAQTIDDFDLIIEFSSDMTSSRDWVEQIAVRSQTPLLVAASGAVAPALRPYEQTRQIRALLSGYPDALAYEELLGQNGPAFAQSTAQALAILLFLSIVFLAAFRSLLPRQSPTGN